MFIMFAAFSKFRAATGRGHGELASGISPQQSSANRCRMRGAKSQQQKTCRPFFYHVTDRTDGNSISARFFARLVNLKLKQPGKIFLDSSHMKL